MKAKPVILCVIAFLIGAMLGALGAFAYSGKMIAESVVLLKTLELRKSADPALEAYKHEKPKVGIWALSQHLKLIDELNEIEYPSRWELDTHAIITHARLAKLHDTLNLPKGKARHTHEAIALAKGSGLEAFEHVTSEKSLWELLETFDTHDVP